MPLTGQQIGRIRNALLAAFDRDELKDVLFTCMDVEFDHIVKDDDLSAQVLELVRWADRQKRIPELVKCLHEDRPADAELAALAVEAPGWAAGGAAAPAPGGPAPAPTPVRRAGWIAAALAAVAVIAVALLVWRAWSPASPTAPSVPEAMAAATETATPTATPALNAADAVTGGAAGATADATVVSLFGNWIATASAAQATMAAAPAATPDATVAAVVNEILARATATPTPTVTPFGRPPVNGAGFSAKLWQPGRTLRVRFLGGDPQVQARVIEIAQEWTQYANITFAFGDDPDAEIRIAFDPSGSWAYIGTDALQVPQDDPTMNFGWLEPDTDEDTFRWTVLREFGHALGLGNEHQNSNADIPWDEAAVIAFYTERYGWSEQQVRANVLTRHSPDVLAVPKPFDRASVMMFPIPNDQTVGDYEIEGNSPRLSPLDRQSIAQLYPRPAPSAATAAPTDEPPPSPGESGAGNGS